MVGQILLLRSFLLVYRTSLKPTVSHFILVNFLNLWICLRWLMTYHTFMMIFNHSGFKNNNFHTFINTLITSRQMCTIIRFQGYNETPWSVAQYKWSFCIGCLGNYVSILRVLVIKHLREIFNYERLNVQGYG